MAFVNLEGVFIDFPVFQTSNRSLKKNLIRLGTGGKIARDSADRVIIRALNGISLQIKEGDRLGLIGPNGSGKTTLLRVLAGIYEPVVGEIHFEGRITPLFDVALGIDSELTGYDNIKMRAAYLGIPQTTITSKTDEIAEFTELGQFLDLPVRTYSAGMMLRLAFSVSVSIQPEILLLDEWISAGDASFIHKAENKMKELLERSSIVVIASHSMVTIRNNCNKCVLIDHGDIVLSGETEEVLDYYTENYS